MVILIADDESDIRNLIKISLEENGYTVLTAQNGKEAWDILTTQDVHLAILDVMMPVMDGFNLLRKIREHSTIPVIFLTARADDMDKVLGLGLGADDYLAKPFSIAELVARVGAQLRRSNEYLSQKEKSNVTIEYGDLSVDKEKCCVYKAGEPAELGAKEYKLLLIYGTPEGFYKTAALPRGLGREYYLTTTQQWCISAASGTGLRTIRKIKVSENTRAWLQAPLYRRKAMSRKLSNQFFRDFLVIFLLTILDVLHLCFYPLPAD